VSVNAYTMVLTKINGFSSPQGLSSEKVMNTKKCLEKERSFSIELNNKQNLKNISLTNDSQENVLIEGNLGELKIARWVSEDILEVAGSVGVLRVNIAKQEILEVTQQ
jgi:hypothetical protein